jgi:rare lipoprotein A (peptidoglycan hydrolase)
MKAGTGRPWRKERFENGHATGAPVGRWLRGVSLALAILSLALAPLAAKAQTGGAATPTAEHATGHGLVFSSPMRSAGATWYGPGLYGNGTACGQTLRPGTIGVAHRTLPCGTTLKFSYHGHTLVTKVIDRGPYTRGNDFDLTNGARLKLGFEGVGTVHYAVAISHEG